MLSIADFMDNREMRTCSFITNDLNFEPDSIQPCCNVRALRVPSFPFSGGPLNLPDYLLHLKNVIAELQEHTSLCCNCPHLEEIDVPETQTVVAEVFFRTVSLNMHRRRCNCKCVYCSLWREKGPVYAVLPALRSLFASDMLAHDCFFSWGGGEPSILPEFEECAAAVRKEGYRQYIHTNALRYSPAVAELLQSGVGAVNVSLDSGTAETYKKVKGVDGFAVVLRTLARYRERAPSPDSIHLKYIIFDKTNRIQEIRNFFRVCQKLNIRNVQFSFNFLEKNAGEIHELSIAAAAFFLVTAHSLGMVATPFFVDEAELERIKAFVV
jgi:sulfatase maturation enzyme AslB (radical SAM superfamily)